jgi:hypothetical protein
VVPVKVRHPQKGKWKIPFTTISKVGFGGSYVPNIFVVGTTILDACV